MNKTLEKTIVGDTTPTNKNVLWIDSKNNQIKYNNNNKWLRTSNHISQEAVTILNSLGYTYISAATPSIIPVTLTGNEKVFYITTEEGDYSNFGLGNISELSVIKSESGNWKVEDFEVIRTLKEELYKKQDTLVSGTNIKTVNGKSLLGEGNIVISGGGETIDLSDYATKNYVTDTLTENDRENKELITKVQSEISTDGTIYKVPYEIRGLIVQSSGLLVNNNFLLYYAPIKAGKEYTPSFGASDSGNIQIAFSEELPAKNVLVSNFKEHNNAYWTDENRIRPTFIAPFDGYFCFSIDTRIATLTDVAILEFGYDSFGKRIETSVEKIGNDLISTDRELSLNLSTDSKFILDSQVIDGVIIGKEKILNNSNFELYYVSCKKGESLRVNILSSDRKAGFTQELPKLGVTIENYQTFDTSTVANQTVFVAPFDGYFCFSINKAGENFCEIYKDNNGLAMRVKELEEAKGNNDQIESDTYGKMLTTSVISTEGSSLSKVIKGDFVEGGLYVLKITKGFDSFPDGRFLLFGYTENSTTIGQKTYYEPVVEYIMPKGAKSIFFRIGEKFAESTEIEIEVYRANAILPALDALLPNSEFNFNAPSYLYAIDNVGDANRQIMQSIYIEGLIDAKTTAKLNNGIAKYIFPRTNSKAKETFTDSILLDGKTFKKEKDFKVVSTRSSIIDGKKIKHLAIGDSWCAAVVKDLDGTETIPWGYVSAVANEFYKLNADGSYNGKFISLGTVNYKTRQGKYKDADYSIYSNNEGRGGWSGATYLRFPDSTRTGNTGVFSEKVAWDACGLGRKQEYGSTYDETKPYEEYVADESHRIEYLTTAMGYYHWDYSTELLNHCGVSGEYNGTAEQKAAIDTYMENVLDNPVNPFYDRQVAMDSKGEYAFSLAKYIERYATLEDDGETKLVYGETTGTKIVYQSRFDNYKVCKPTHVTIELAINDYKKLGHQQRFADLEKMAELIRQYDSSIKVGIVQVHTPGVFDAFAMSSKGHFNEADITDVSHDLGGDGGVWGVNKIFSDKYTVQDGIDGIYYVPTYFAHGSTRAGAKYVYTPTGEKLISDGTDNLHPALDAYKEIGYQILCWMLYTL